jgi:hypothetical protein
MHIVRIVRVVPRAEHRVLSEECVRVSVHVSECASERV